MSFAGEMMYAYFYSSGVWTAPDGVFGVRISLVGSGGKAYFDGGGGGGLSSCDMFDVPVVPGTRYTCTVALAGSEGTTSFKDGTNVIMLAYSGTNAGLSAHNPGVGGALGIGQHTYAGGNGASWTNSTMAGGGGGCGNGSAGNASTWHGGAGNHGGGAGGNGTSSGIPGVNGVFPGGGAGGKTGGPPWNAGTHGFVLIDWPQPGNVPVSMKVA